MRFGAFVVGLAGLLFSVAGRVGAASPRFEASFDAKSAAASTAEGAVAPEADDNAVRTFVEGIVSNALLLEGERLCYPARGRIDVEQGTLAFWIKPVDWGNRSAEFTPIWHLGRPGGSRWRLHLYYAKNAGAAYGTLQFRSMIGGTEYTVADTQLLAAGALARGEWTHVVLTWDTMAKRMYLNGREAGQVSYGLPVDRPELLEDDRIEFMPTRFWRGDHRRKTVLDEVRLYPAVLNGDQVAELFSGYGRAGGASLRRALMSVPKVSGSIVVDGVLTPAEWVRAATAPLMIKNSSGRISSMPAYVSVMHDGERLHLAYEVPFAGDLALPAEGRDFAVFSGDEAEFGCRVAVAGEEHEYQFAVAPNGAFACRKDGDWSWETDFAHAARLEAERWTAEMSVSLGELGYDPGAGAPLAANFGLHRATAEDLGGVFERWLCWSASGEGRLAFYDEARLGRLVFRRDAAAVRVTGVGDVTYGRLAVCASAGPPGAVRASVAAAPEDGEALTRRAVLGAESETIEAKLGWKRGGTLTVTGVSTEDEVCIFHYGARVYVRDPFDFSFVCDPAKRMFLISADCRGLRQRCWQDMRAGKVKVRAALCAADGRELQAAECAATGAAAALELPFGRLGVGRYVIRVAVEAGDFRIEKQRPFERPDPVFLAQRKGVARTVPAPWSPLRRDVGVVRTAFHRYEFGDGPFPVRAVSHGQEVLAREPRLILKVGGREAEIAPLAAKDEEAAADRIVSSGECEVRKAGLRLSWRRCVAYDGLIRCDLELAPVAGAATIDSLALEIEVAPAAATYAVTPTDGGKSYAHEWITKPQPVIGAFPTAWLTGERAGFCFFTDTDANWTRCQGRDPILLLKRGSQPVIRAEIVTRPVTLRGPATYVFGLMATPGKPPRPDFRTIHAEGWGVVQGQTLQTRGWWCDKDVWFENNFVLRRLLDPEKARAGIARYSRKGIDSIPYACTNATLSNHPLHDYYGLDWAIHRDGRPTPKHTRVEYEGAVWYFVSACPGCASYADYMCYYVDKYLAETDFKGLYLDFGGTTRCDGPRHGCRRRDVFDEGRIPASYNVFAVRALYERFRRIIHEHEPAGFLYTHCWDNFHPAVMSFVDIVNPGEEYMHTARRRPAVYMTDTPRQKWQSVYRSQAMGAAVQFLGQCCAVPGILQMARDQRLRLSRPLLACCLLHDVPCSGGMYTEVESVWGILDRNNVAAASFEPYWRQQKIAVDEQGVFCSYYAWPGERRRLACFGNWNAEDKSVQVRFTDGAPGGLTATDEETGKPADLAAPLLVRGYDFRVLGIRWEGGE